MNFNEKIQKKKTDLIAQREARIRIQAERQEYGALMWLRIRRHLRA